MARLRTALGCQEQSGSGAKGGTEERPGGKDGDVLPVELRVLLGRL
jgi:hypothetical protein